MAVLYLDRQYPRSLVELDTYYATADKGGLQLIVGRSSIHI